MFHIAEGFKAGTAYGVRNELLVGPLAVARPS